MPVLTQDPGDTPSKTITLPCSYLPYVRGALQQLLLQATWQTDDPVVLQQTQDRVSTLISLFDECSAADLPFACPYDFSSGQEGWVLASVQFPGWGRTGGVYNTGGPWWQATDDPVGAGCGYFLDIIKVFSPAVRLTQVSMVYDMFKGPFSIDSPVNGVWLYDSGFTALASSLVAADTDPDGSSKIISWAGDVSGVTYVRGSVVASWTACGGEAGFGRIRAAEIHGIGSVSCT